MRGPYTSMSSSTRWASVLVLTGDEPKVPCWMGYDECARPSRSVPGGEMRMWLQDVLACVLGRGKVSLPLRASALVRAGDIRGFTCGRRADTDADWGGGHAAVGGERVLTRGGRR